MPRKKVIDEEPEEEETYEWDKPRIVIFFAVIAALLFGGLLYKHFVLDAQSVPSAGSFKSVQGASSSSNDTTQLPSVESIKQSAGQEIQTIQKQASQITVQQIASSSPQVQQLIQQLQQLPSQPGNIAKQTCENICNSL